MATINLLFNKIDELEIDCDDDKIQCIICQQPAIDPWVCCNCKTALHCFTCLIQSLSTNMRCVYKCSDKPRYQRPCLLHMKLVNEAKIKCKNCYQTFQGTNSYRAHAEICIRKQEGMIVSDHQLRQCKKCNSYVQNIEQHKCIIHLADQIKKLQDTKTNSEQQLKNLEETNIKCKRKRLGYNISYDLQRQKNPNNLKPEDMISNDFEDMAFILKSQSDQQQHYQFSQQLNNDAIMLPEEPKYQIKKQQSYDIGYKRSKINEFGNYEKKSYEERPLRGQRYYDQQEPANQIIYRPKLKDQENQYYREPYYRRKTDYY